MDKTKAPPIPEKTASQQPKEGTEKQIERQSTPEPTFVRGTIDPPNKK